MRSLYEIEAANQEARRLLIKVSTTLASALYDNKRPDAKGNLVRLRITATERDQLKANLVTAYGRPVTKWVAAGTALNTAPGRLLWGFLTDPKRLAADAQ